MSFINNSGLLLVLVHVHVQGFFLAQTDLRLLPYVLEIFCVHTVKNDPQF